MHDEGPKTPAYLEGRLDALQRILESTIVQLPELAMRSVLDEAMRHARDLEKEARTRDNDAVRDRSEAAYEAAYSLEEAIESQIAELESGDRLRTVQPATPPGALR